MQRIVYFAKYQEEIVLEPHPVLTSDPGDADLAATALIDSDHPAIVNLATELAPPGPDSVARAQKLYLSVRDGIRYDPYTLDLSTAGMRASKTLTQAYGWCVPKATLLAALCRAAGLPARVGYADVRNHFSTRRLRELLNDDVYYWHSYTAIHLDGQWLKATPAFDAKLCSLSGLTPLEFDGRNDSILQAYDNEGRRRLEYLRYVGEYQDVPLDEIRATFLEKYPRLVAQAGYSFQEEFAQERAARSGSSG